MVGVIESTRVDISMILMMRVNVIGMVTEVLVMMHVDLAEIVMRRIIIDPMIVDHIDPLVTDTVLINLVMVIGIRDPVLLLLTVLNGKVRRKGPKRMFI